jgi:hypothetical protein
MPVAGLAAAGMAPTRIAGVTDSSLWLLTLATAARRDRILSVTATLAGALLVIPTGLT